MKEFVLILLLAASACTHRKATTTADDSCETHDILHGVALSPLGFPVSYDNITDFFGEIQSEHSGASLLWNGAWRDDTSDGTDSGDIPAGATLLASNAATYCFEPIAVFGWRTGTTPFLNTPTNSENSWANTEARTTYARAVAAYASTYKPRYIFLGNENDVYYESNPTDYANWIEAYNTAYAAIKEVSPDTSVGPVFNFEHLSGTGT